MISGMRTEAKAGYGVRHRGMENEVWNMGYRTLDMKHGIWNTDYGVWSVTYGGLRVE